MSRSSGDRGQGTSDHPCLSRDLHHFAPGLDLSSLAPCPPPPPSNWYNSAIITGGAVNKILVILTTELGLWLGGAEMFCLDCPDWHNENIVIGEVIKGWRGEERLGGMGGNLARFHFRCHDFAFQVLLRDKFDQKMKSDCCFFWVSNVYNRRTLLYDAGDNATGWRQKPCHLRTVPVFQQLRLSPRSSQWWQIFLTVANQHITQAFCKPK